MKTFKSLAAMSLLLVSTSSVFAAAHAGAPMTMPSKSDMPKAGAMAASDDMADAEVRKVDKENKKVTLKHGAIKNLDMPGMTMVFQVKDATMLDSLKDGDKIRFKAEKAGGAILVTEIQPVK